MLTKRQTQVLDFVAAYQKRRGYAPSLDEIRKRLRLASVSTAHFHIAKLRDLGLLAKEDRRPRAIATLGRERMVKIPFLGAIAAGAPIEAIAERESIAIPKRALPQGAEVYALRVHGESMIDEGIRDGDTILVRRQDTAENGQKVIALLNGNEATLKTFYKERGRIRLQPANKNYAPIIVTNKQQFSLQGVLFDVIRTRMAEPEANNFLSPIKTALPRGEISEYLNKVCHGDVMDLLKDVPDNSVDMVFGDPDYNVGINYGGHNYTKKFEDYIRWYVELTKESMRVLKEDGNLFMMNYPKQNAHLRVKYLDALFPYVHEYVWVYNTNVGHSPKRFTTAHRSILHVRKSDHSKFFKENVALPYKNPTDRRILHNVANGSKGRMPYSWLEFNLVKNVSREKTEHACQVPQKLTEMLVKASTKPDDIVLVLFGGSGAEIDVCRNLRRQFISAELNERYCDIINDRLANGQISPKYRLGPRGKKKVKQDELSSVYWPNQNDYFAQV